MTWIREVILQLTNEYVVISVPLRMYKPRIMAHAEVTTVFSPSSPYAKKKKNAIGYLEI